MPITNPSWIPPIEITFDEGKPIRSEQGLMLAGNPIAIAEAATGAPKVRGEALGSVMLPWGEQSEGTGTTPTEYTANVNRLDLIYARFSFGPTTGGSTLQVSFSNDNGSNWDLWNNLLTVSSVVSGDLRISISDAEAVIEDETENLGSRLVTSAIPNIPAGSINAFRFRASGGGYLIKPFILGGAA